MEKKDIIGINRQYRDANADLWFGTTALLTSRSRLMPAGGYRIRPYGLKGKQFHNCQQIDGRQAPSYGANGGHECAQTVARWGL